MATLTQINVYPIKSLGGIQLSHAFVGETGLALDRQLMLVDKNGKFVTARKWPHLLAFQVLLDDKGWVVVGPSGEQLSIARAQFKQSVDVNIWRHDMKAACADESVNAWFSKQLNSDVRLVSVCDESARYVADSKQEIAFSDGYPLLIIGQGSLNELNQRATEDSIMDQFRTNLVFDGEMGFVEDTWQRVRIGEVEFKFVKPCERCVMTTVNFDDYSFRKNREPLATLKQFRADPKGRLMFGENLIAVNSGMIKVGDEIEVLSTHEPIKYGAK
ncbi:MOSC domain-containing protein [Psychrobium sp. MM17-31]|uniref:MOSC domain-containing protein n=1 Tax=Psychrobium sp. MM17-31 TaxID=2917758 RepID=UPI001EF53834|nr:MOSC N-terminal beta barrel domain-containing protein [Psychrobium sp. MM17-31]MCG7533232.1 MOSC domain-containing protein [Psychrobium sp. MM17-31]